MNEEIVKREDEAEVVDAEVVKEPFCYECPECFHRQGEPGMCPNSIGEERDPVHDFDTPLMPKQSTFGAGLVVCLTKFAEHFWNRWEDQIYAADRWAKMSESERAQIRADAAKHPNGDSAHAYGRMDRTMEIFENDFEAYVTHLIELWANGASDHFYDLDRERAPQPLIELADLALEMGHGFTGKKWTIDDMKKLHDLWEESAMELDKRLDTKPNWGEH